MVVGMVVGITAVEVTMAVEEMVGMVGMVGE